MAEQNLRIDQPERTRYPELHVSRTGRRICTFASARAAWMHFTVLSHFRTTLALDIKETG
jgi:hypothetical protein